VCKVGYKYMAKFQQWNTLIVLGIICDKWSFNYYFGCYIY
jgi:hypothetical protein